MLTKTGDFCEIHGSLSVEERIKVHKHMTSVYNGYTMKACKESQFYNRHVSLSDTDLYIERSMAKENIFYI
jgi:hypothetical protein